MNYQDSYVTDATYGLERTISGALHRWQNGLLRTEDFSQAEMTGSADAIQHNIYCYK